MQCISAMTIHDRLLSITSMSMSSAGGCWHLWLHSLFSLILPSFHTFLSFLGSPRDLFWASFYLLLSLHSWGKSCEDTLLIFIVTQYSIAKKGWYHWFRCYHNGSKVKHSILSYLGDLSNTIKKEASNPCLPVVFCLRLLIYSPYLSSWDNIVFQNYTFLFFRDSNHLVKVSLSGLVQKKVHCDF